MLSVEHSDFFWAVLVIVPLVVLFVLVLRWKTQTRKAMGDEALVSRLIAGYAPRLFRLKFILLLLALVAGMVAASNLRMPSDGEQTVTKGIDVMIAIDVSKSMLSNDIKPNRLERAKQLCGQIIAASANNRVGMVLFAGEAYLQLPVTPDIAEARLYLSNVSVDAVPVQGTNLSQALQLCNRALDTKEKAHKAVVLISDGEDHDPGAEKAARQLFDQGVAVFTVGIGTPEGAPIVEPGTTSYKTDATGKTVISKLNEGELQAIATATGGQYFRLNNAPATAKAVTDALGGLEKKLVEAGGEREYLSFAPLFAALALLLMVVEVFVPEVKRRGGTEAIRH